MATDLAVRIVIPSGAQATQLDTAIAQFQLDAYATLDKLKEGYVFWDTVKRIYPSLNLLPWKTLQEAVGEHLYNLNESVNKSTEQYAQLIVSLINGKNFLVGWQETPTSDLHLAVVAASKMPQITALARPSAALQGLGQWQGIVARVALSAAKFIFYGAAALVTSWFVTKAVDVTTTKIKAADDQRKLELQNQLAAQYGTLSKQNPQLANELMDQFSKMQQAAASADNQGYFEKLFGTGVGGGMTWGLGGIVVGLLLAMYLGKRR